MDFTIEQLQAGNRDAWDQAYDFLSVWVINVLWDESGVVSREDLEDAAIVAIKKLADQGAQVEGGIEGLQKFVLTIAKNELLDQLERRNAQKRGAGKVVSIEAQPPGTEYKWEKPTPYETMEATERALLLREALNQLPEKQREVVEGYVLEDLSYAEIAQRVGLSEGSVGVYKDRGLAALRPIVEKLGLFVRNEAGIPLKNR